MAPTDSSAKRKRGVADTGAPRPSPSNRATSATVSAAAAAASAAVAAQEAQGIDSYDEQAINQLIAHNNGELQNGGQHNPTETAQAALTHYQVPASFEPQHPGGQHGDHTAHFGIDQHFADALKNDANQQSGLQGQQSSNPKPPVGSDEWHRIRRDNHKEVERRRRETINEGINDLAHIVPGCEKNKGSILQRAVAYISQLKENEQKNIEKWTLEKLLLDQAITELSASGERLKADLTDMQRERDAYKSACESNGISVNFNLDDGTGKVESDE